MLEVFDIHARRIIERLLACPEPRIRAAAAAAVSLARDAPPLSALRRLALGDSPLLSRAGRAAELGGAPLSRVRFAHPRPLPTSACLLPPTPRLLASPRLRSSSRSAVACFSPCPLSWTAAAPPALCSLWSQRLFPTKRWRSLLRLFSRP